MRQLLAACYPTDVGIEKMQRAQRRPYAGGLPFPVLAAVDAVPHHAVIADGPALVLIDKLHGMQRRIVEVSQISRRRAGNNRHTEYKREKKGSHCGSFRCLGHSSLVIRHSRMTND